MTQPNATTSEKIQAHHRDRLAVVYIRQSTPQQVERHQESARLQYALVDHAVLLGWERERVTVIDEDQGRSGASSEGRLGFQKLFADVGLGRVGLVLGIEMSRLARSCCDWHQLIEICALRRTLLGDSQGIYDPNCLNDRLLLGLKATISEAELHLIKLRMSEGRKAKAQRGELALPLPRGYLRRPDGSVMLDPDEQVQATVRLVFALFERKGSVCGVLRHLVDHDIRLPDRRRTGAGKGDLEWRRPNRATLVDMLHNPLYAGVYAYGRRSVETAGRQPGRPATGRRRGHDLENGVVVLRDRMPAYLSWDQYVTNLDRMTANRSENQGVPRHGPALLSGLLVCGRCGHRMFTAHNNNGRDPRYFCGLETASYGMPICQSLSGHALDDHITGLVLQAVTPSALETSLQLAEDLELERADQHRQWRLRLERARYEADRARRQYAAVEPENRLVARTLERQWEEALATERRLQAEYEQFQSRAPIRPSAAEQDAIRRLAEDVPALWRAPTTTVTDRQELIRLVLECIVVSVAGTTEAVTVECHWAGGARTRTELRRPVARLTQLSDCEALLGRVADLHRAGHTRRTIADTLNDEGWHPAKRRTTFSSKMVGDLLRRQGLVSRQGQTLADRVERQAGEMTVLELAQRLDMPHQTLFCWLRRGKLQGRLACVCGHPIWLIPVDQAELERLKRLREAPPRTGRSPSQSL
jgi:DNA invertase Pin-like site-specific DNA recombinase